LAGHTLRLLALPQFLDGLLGKLIQLRMKLSGLTSTLQAFLGDKGAQERAQTLDTAMQKLEEFKTKMIKVEERLKDNDTTNFLVVTVPTTLAVKESGRLIVELKEQGIAVSDVVVNQCVDEFGGTLLFFVLLFPFPYYVILTTLFQMAPLKLQQITIVDEVMGKQNGLKS
jgi:arsenite-transporting ATPase